MNKKIFYGYSSLIIITVIVAASTIIENVPVRQDTSDYINEKAVIEGKTDEEYTGGILDDYVSEKREEEIAEIELQIYKTFNEAFEKCSEDYSCVKKFASEINSYLSGVELYKCNNGEPTECPFGLSGGLLTRCYQNEEKNNWITCSTGWVKV